MKLLTRALLSAVLFVGSTAWADSASIIQAVETKYEKVEVLKASFNQTVTSPLYGAESSTGTVTLKRPAMMRWVFTGEGAKEYIADGKHVWIFTPADKQVVKVDNLAVGDGAESFLQNLAKLGEMFEITVLEETDSLKRLKLVPKQEGQMKELELSLNKDLVVQKVVFLDNFDSTTELVFSDVTLGGTVDDKLFQFTVPEGVEVISTEM